MPRRRLAAVAALAVLGALVLTGCGKAQPGTAAYVGDTRHTERQLDDLVDEIRRVDPDQAPTLRGQVLTQLILNDLAHRAADAEKITIPPAGYNEYAERFGLPADSKLVRFVADYAAVIGALQTNVEPVDPTEEEFRDVWAELLKDPRLDPNTYGRLLDLWRSHPTVPVALGIRKALREQVARTKVVVSPLYSPLVANVGSGDAPVTMLLGDGAGFVSDLAPDLASG
jgi:hypothetical protein